jgi:hypothetical protein
VPPVTQARSGRASWSDASFNPRVKANRCRLGPRTGTRDKKAALHKSARRARSSARAAEQPIAGGTLADTAALALRRADSENGCRGESRCSL